jgi:hypothetical protein
MTKPRKHMVAIPALRGLYAAKHECRIPKETQILK